MQQVYKEDATVPAVIQHDEGKALVRHRRTFTLPATLYHPIEGGGKKISKDKATVFCTNEPAGCREEEETGKYDNLENMKFEGHGKRSFAKGTESRRIWEGVRLVPVTSLAQVPGG